MESWEVDLQRKEERDRAAEAAFQEAFEDCVIIAMQAIDKIEHRLLDFDYTKETIKEIINEALEV